MLYCVSDANQPVNFLYCGNLVSNGGFLHDKRLLNEFVFIIVNEGILHINQNGHPLDIHSGESLLLFPGQLHYGYKPSCGRLSYFWTHFTINDPNYKIYNKSALFRHNIQIKKELSNVSDIVISPSANYFLLPEHGHLSPEKRSIPFFTQLLDIVKSDNYLPTCRSKYALNLLLSEFTHEYLACSSDLVEKHIPAKVKFVIDHIKAHYEEPIKLADLSMYFGYNPTYLSKLIKQYTGYPLNAYLNRIRLSAAKNLLCLTNIYTIQEIGSMCGFTDEKYFMRLFKKIEGVTPSQYRNMFNEKNINRN